MRIATIEKVFNLLSKDYPNPQTELKYINQYTFLISVMLSAQATDISVNKATKKLFKIVKNSKDMVKLGETNLKKYIKTIGLYNDKAKNIIKLSKILLSKYNKFYLSSFISRIAITKGSHTNCLLYMDDFKLFYISKFYFQL